jgi:hypothetical protein
MESIKVTLHWSRETKGTHRYDAPPGEETLRTLYVPKSALAGRERPDAIVVTVEAVD